MKRLSPWPKRKASQKSARPDPKQIAAQAVEWLMMIKGMTKAEAVAEVERRERK